MKKWLWAVVTIVIALVVGGYTYSHHQLQEQGYAADMQSGKQAIKAKRYSDAEAAFTRASRTIINDTVAQRYLSQTQTFVAGQQAITERRFEAAQTEFTTVKTLKKGSSVLVARSQTALALLDTIISQRKQDNKLYQKALDLNQANEFTDSNGVLMVLFQNKQFTKDYYQDIYRKAKGLRHENNAALKSLTGSTPITNNETQTVTSNANKTSEQPAKSAESQPAKQAQSSSTSQSSSATTSSAQSSAVTTESSSATTSSSTTVDAAGIQATRDELNAAGLDGNHFTDAQIQAIMQQAAAAHISPVEAVRQGLSQP
ncbi:cell surface protein [Lactiplantibacillus daoliensis]|uniref:Cell surface protein n=1 Tax=Lactiplantibacillus daoliensis TaxID=2559916 RepID=A0ABW1UI38_9LACO|nr:cell surface protein [Lactiplantibacillus daoliensis]